jgi:hypothetical protein
LFDTQPLLGTGEFIAVDDVGELLDVSGQFALARA